MEGILLYNLDNAKGQQIKQLCTLLKIRFKSISPDMYAEPIGALAGIKGVEKNNTPFTALPFTDEILLFLNFTDEALWSFLSKYREAGIEKVELKAGLTPYNLTWDSVQLRNELKKEHDEIEQNSK